MKKLLVLMLLGAAPAAAQIVAPEYSNSRDEALMVVAPALVKVGDATGALNTAASITNVHARAMALIEVAAAQAEAGDTAGGLDTARGIDGVYYRSSALSMVARAQAETDDFAGATQTIALALKYAKFVRHAASQADALSVVAWAQSETGDMAAAGETAALSLDKAGEVKSPVGYGLGLLLSTEALVRAGDVKGAVDRAKNLKHAMTRTIALICRARWAPVASRIANSFTAASSVSESTNPARVSKISSPRRSSW